MLSWKRSRSWRVARSVFAGAVIAMSVSDSSS